MSASAAAGSARLEALRAQRTHPATLWFGPTYGVMERTDAGWLMSAMSDPTPQEARDGLGWWFRILARRRSTDEVAREAYWEASALLERERLNEIVVAGRYLRVVRADQFVRYGLTGPEPPRSTDPDADAGADPEVGTGAGAGRSGSGRPGVDKLTGGLLGPAETPGSAPLLGERWEAVPKGPMVPPDVTRHAQEALATHPRIVMLSTRFAVAQQEDAYWPAQTVAIPSPREAREALATYFDRIAPVMLRPSPAELAEFRKAARLLEREQINQVTVAGRRFRIVRVETVVRVGPDGPEPPRPSDHDPDPPLTGETAELRTWDLIDDEP